MATHDLVKVFDSTKIRVVWDDEKEKYFFSVVDVVGVLTESVDGRKYWNKLKQRLKEEGSESVTNCHQLKLVAADGARYRAGLFAPGGVRRRRYRTSEDLGAEVRGIHGNDTKG